MTIASTLILAFLAAPMPQRPEPPKRRSRTVTWQPFALLGATLAIIIALSFVPTE